MRKGVLAIGLCVLISVVFCSGCLETEKKEYVPSGNTTTGGGTLSGGKLTILSNNMNVTYNVYLGYTATVTGQAKNTGDARLSYASVDVKFYDANGNLLSTSFDGISDLDPNETWNFEVMHMDETEIASYTIAVGTCW